MYNNKNKNTNINKINNNRNNNNNDNNEKTHLGDFIVEVKNAASLFQAF